MTNQGKHERFGVWQADIASIVLLVLFVLLIFGIEAWLAPQFTPTSLLLTGILIAIVPAVIWLAFFYRRDRLEPEPKHMVFRTFILGGLLASAIGIPLVEGFFAVPSWLPSSPVWAQLLGGLLIVGMTQEFLKYAAVRFTIYHSPEFDGLTDGIVYTTAVGLGYATMLNINFVLSSGGVNLGTGTIRIVLTALAHAAFSGIVGYFLGKQRFEEKPLWWMPLGLLLAAGLNSLFFYLRGALGQGSFGVPNLWVGLILAVILTGGVTAFLSRTIHKDVELLLQTEELTQNG